MVASVKKEDFCGIRIKCKEIVLEDSFVMFQVLYAVGGVAEGGKYGEGTAVLDVGWGAKAIPWLLCALRGGYEANMRN